MGGKSNTLVILLIVGLLLAGIAFYLRSKSQEAPEPSAPGYYTGEMKGKGQQQNPGQPQ